MWFYQYQLKEVTISCFLDPNIMHWNVFGLGEYSDPDLLGGFFKQYICQELMSKQ